MTIRALEARDVEAILAIQAACPEIAQWTAWDYDRVARGEMAGWVAEEHPNGEAEFAAEVAAEGGVEVAAKVDVEGAAEVGIEVAGFLVARRLSTELEILNFAVEFNSRRCGIGAALLAASAAVGAHIPGNPAPSWKCVHQISPRCASTPATNSK